MTILEINKDLKVEYAELMLQEEILQSRINAVKKQIIEELNKPFPKK